MVLVTSVFLTQVLCLLVPCDPNYKLPDTRPFDTSTSVKLYNSNWDHGIVYNALEQKLHPKLVDVRELKSEASPVSHYSDDCDEQPYVQTNSGIVQGYRIQVVGGRKICAFEGIPYAEAPEGPLRFRSPIPKLPWKGILKATQYGPQCMQYNVPQAFRTVGKEDCLFLNVYTKQAGAKKLMPVIVFIHGGGFFFGTSATYGPAYLLQRDVVLVTIQYRVGVLGFFSTGDSVCPGNMGLKDQSLALKWVHDNIIAFGGDPSRVTLMGQSAGSVSVHLHMLSQLTRPYFRNAVSLSGTAFNYWSFYDKQQTRNFTNAFASSVGCPIHDSVKLFECIKAKNPVDLVSRTPDFLDDWPYPANAFRPSIEVVEGNPDPFLTDYPENIYRRNEVANVPWISTTVSGEGYAFLLFPFITNQITTLQNNWDALALDLIDADNLDLDKGKVLKRLNRFYFRDAPPEKSNVGTFAQIVTDRMFVSGVYESLKAHIQVAPTYSYLFDYNGKYNAITNYGYPASEWGVGHTEDAFYLFNATRIYGGFQRGDVEFDISRIMVNMIVNFAAKNVPLFTTDTGEDIEVWLPHKDPNNLNFLGISKYIGMVGDPLKKGYKFWRSMHFPDTPTNVIVSGPGPVGPLGSISP